MKSSPGLWMLTQPLRARTSSHSCGLVHLGDGILVHGQFVVWQARCREEAAPVHEGGVVALLDHGWCVCICIDAFFELSRR